MTLAEAAKKCLAKVQDVEEMNYIVSLDLYIHTDGEKVVVRPEIGYSKDGLPTKFFKGPRYGIQNMENYDVEIK